MKSAVKTKTWKTNNKASFGGNLPRNNMEQEAVFMPMGTRDLNDAGTWTTQNQVGPELASFIYEGCCMFDQSLLVCTKKTF
jgi:hypothetical protein